LPSVGKYNDFRGKGKKPLSTSSIKVKSICMGPKKDQNLTHITPH
jgi:hypothetical protein